MTVESWRSEKREQPVELPDEVPGHMVERLLATIEATPEQYGAPSPEWWLSIKAQVKAIREEQKK